MDKERLLDKAIGCIVGGAIGDTLGYAVEFFSLDQITKIYGKEGIKNYELDEHSIAHFSDDTQMTLFTAEGLLNAFVNGKLSEKDLRQSICRAYDCWYTTQTRPPEIISDSWLSHLHQLWVPRAPGNTCMSAMESIRFGGIDCVSNFSKGCGGVMRVAPIGVFAAAHPVLFDFEFTGRIAGMAAFLTHKHPLSTYSSMALAMIVSECILRNEIDRDILRSIIIDHVFKTLGTLFKGDKHLGDLFNLILKAMALSGLNKPDTECIRELGEGWVAEETLAIAVFSVMRYINDFEKSIVCSVNHSGDSDSTGAVAGNIMGAIVGYKKIPDKFKANLELHDILVSTAEDLCSDPSQNRMKQRYLEHLT